MSAVVTTPSMICRTTIAVCDWSSNATIAAAKTRGGSGTTEAVTSFPGPHKGKKNVQPVNPRPSAILWAKYDRRGSFSGSSWIANSMARRPRLSTRIMTNHRRLLASSSSHHTKKHCSNIMHLITRCTFLGREPLSTVSLLVIFGKAMAEP